MENSRSKYCAGRKVRAVVHEMAGRSIEVAAVERKPFYELSRQATAIVQTGETRPYSCFLITKGVV